MFFERTWNKIASPKPFPPMTEVVQTLCTYPPFDQIVSEVAAIFAHVRDVSSEIEDLNRSAKCLRAVLPRSNEAPENSSPSNRDAIAALVEELNQELNEFQEMLREYHGEEAEAPEDILWKRTFLKRKLATSIHKEAARIKGAIDANVKSIERLKALPIQ